MLSLSLPEGPLTVLALGAHPDDIEIGCGGTLLALAATQRVTPTHLVLTGTADRQDTREQRWQLFGRPCRGLLDSSSGRARVGRGTEAPDSALNPRTDNDTLWTIELCHGSVAWPSRRRA